MRITAARADAFKLRISSPPFGGWRALPSVPAYDCHLRRLPISDLPPFGDRPHLTVNHSTKIHAFVRTATDVLAHSDLEAPRLDGEAAAASREADCCTK